MRRLLLASIVFATPLAAQFCGPGQTFFKNDNLAQDPTGVGTVSVIPGLCEGEACGAVFNVASVGPAVKLNMAAVGFFNAGSASGITAAVDLEIFDGVTFAGSVANLGPSVFRWSNATGSSLQVSTNGINTSPDLSSYNIVVTSGKLVCAWWMDFTTSLGSCQAGYSTNFATDYTGVGGCTPQRNLMYIQTPALGWRDPATTQVTTIIFGVPVTVPLCPSYYAGNWIIRVCVEPTAPPTPPSVLSILGPTTPPPGFVLTLQYSSPADPGQQYVCGVSGGTSPGIPWPPYGTIPLNNDVALQFLFPDIFELPGAPTNICTGFAGVLNGSGLAFGNFSVPPVPGVTVWFAFVTLNGHISNAQSITIL
jgi:hypothetical protein